MQTYLNQRKVLHKKTTNMIQDPTVDQHLHVNFLMQTYLNQRKVLFKKTTNMIQDPTVNRGAIAHPGHPLELQLVITPASLTFRLPI